MQALLDKLIEATSSAYAYPLLIKQLLHTPFRPGTAAGDHLPGSSALQLSDLARSRIGQLASGPFAIWCAGMPLRLP